MRLRTTVVSLATLGLVTTLGACSTDDPADAPAPTAAERSTTSTAAPPAPRTLPALRALRGEDARIVDDQGRHVLLRGANVNSLGDYYQDDPESPPVIPLGDDDWDDMAALGFNVTRLIVSWSALEPERGRYDEEYIAEVAEQIDAAAAVGIYTVVDMHQDAWGKFIASAADDVCPDGGEPAIGWDGAPEWATLTDGASTCRTVSRESAPAVGAAWDSFYADRDGIRTALVDTWAHLVESLGDRTSIAGYDLLNEPNNGTDQSASLPALAAFYADTIRAIRSAEQTAGISDDGRIVFFETTVTGLPVSPDFTEDTNIAFAPHNYGESIGPLPIEGTFDYFQTLADSYGAPLWIGEFGFFEDSDAASEKLARYSAKEDSLITAGGAWWQWKQACGDPHGVAEPGGSAGPMTVHLRNTRCPGDVDAGVNPRWVCLWRPYPRATPGAISSLTSTCDGTLDYLASTAEPGDIEVWFPADEGAPSPVVSVENVAETRTEPVEGGFLVSGTATGDYRVTITSG